MGKAGSTRTFAPFADADRVPQAEGLCSADPVRGRVRALGKFLTLGGEKWYIRGLTYGPFAPNLRGEPFPEPQQIGHDFGQIRRLGGNAVRLYHLPPAELLDLAAQHGLR